ncbi:hypothetical protein GmHk_U059825 [Glycine max]|nr:hypothetical protein GmHk_U059825 [Glycine max]
MNPKERWSLVSSNNNQEVVPTSCNEPKDVGLLCPVINQEANLASCNEPKECWSLVFSAQPIRPSLEKQSPRVGLLKSFL